MDARATSTTVVQPAARVCPRCGLVAGGFGPEGLCPACLLRSGLEAAEDSAPALAREDLPRRRRFGDYELLEEIARGGMGVIYRAQQLKLNRTVAVKMILGGQHAGVEELARFRAEAQTAAQLHHPNIVAIHEVGQHEGQPFFSMDFVAGQNLAQLVGNTPLPAKRAAQYLLQVTRAVDYAHGQGVLHRDLKPSNVLIDSATDEPRVTDFGLAKRLEGDASLTMTGQVLGSPGFMPPEQAAGRQKDIGPASDVYSLGAMLYHLLTGRPPFVADTVPATLRMVAEAEPIAPRLLNASVPRDLETICLKCLHKDVARRYTNAQELVEDLYRFLHDEPIRARPITGVERVQRWCARNKPLAVATTVVLVLLIVIAIGSPIAALRINRERIQAETARRTAEANEKRAYTEAVRSERVARLLEGMLNGVGPSVALGRDVTILREILDKSAANLSNDLRDLPSVEADLLSTLGQVYYAIGQTDQAEAMHRRALTLRTNLYGAEHLATAASQHNLGCALYAQDVGTEAENLLRQALSTRRKHLGETNLIVAESLTSLGLQLAEHNQGGEAEELLREALAVRSSLLPAEHPDIAVSLRNLSTTLSDAGRQVEAVELSVKALAMQRKLFGDDHPEIAVSLYALATALFQQGKFPEAEGVQREGVAMQRKLLGAAHPDLAKSISRLAVVLSDQDRHAEALALQREALTMLEKLYGQDHAALNWPRFTLATMLQKAGNTPEAETLLRQTLAMDETRITDPWLMVFSLNNLAELARSRANWSEAHALYLKALAKVAEQSPSDPRTDAVACWSLSGVIFTLLQQGRLEEADSVFRKTMLRKASVWFADPVRVELSVSLLIRQGKYFDAEQIFTNALLRVQLDEAGRLRRLRGNLFARQGRWAEAAVDFEKAVELEPGNVDNFHALAPLLVRAGRLQDYRDNCRKALHRFADTQNPAVAERVAKDCLILPAADSDLEGAVRMAETALARGRNHQGTNWIRVTKGLAEYRQGFWSNSVESVRPPLASLGVNQRDAQAFLILAMAQEQLRQTNEARAALAEALGIFETRLRGPEHGDLGELWTDWIVAHALLEEAKRTIGDGSRAAAK